MAESSCNPHTWKTGHPSSNSDSRNPDLPDLKKNNLPDSENNDLPSGKLNFSKFGLLQQELDINKELSDNDRRQAECKRKELTTFLQLTNCPQKCAIHNLLAVYNYRLDKLRDAKKQLQNVLRIDPTYVSALQDLITLFGDTRLRDVSEKNKYENMLKDVIDKIKCEGNNNEANKIDARYLSSQALAWAYDIHVDTKGTSKLEKSIQLYEEALQVGHSAVDDSEKNDWMYFLALDCIRQNNIRKLWEDEKCYKDNFNKIFNCLLPNLKLTDDKQRLSRVFCLLGDLFSQRPRAMVMPDIVHKSDFEHYWFTPQGCYFRAYELDKTNWICLNRIARVLYEESREVEAKRFIEQSLEINDGISNHGAYRTRARINRIKYNKLMRQHRRQHQSPDRNLLAEAKEDLQECIENNPYVLDFIHLAEVLHRLAWKEESRSHDQAELKVALEWCKDAEDCQDGIRRPELHQRKALIHQDLKEYDSSITSFMQAMQFENPDTKHFNNFLYMFKGMLKRFKAKINKPDDLLKQLAYFLGVGIEKYGNTKIKWGYFCIRYPEEILCILEDLLNSSTQPSLKLAQKCIEKFKDIKPCNSRCKKSDQPSAQKSIEKFKDTKACSSRCKTSDQPSAQKRIETFKDRNACGSRCKTSDQPSVCCVFGKRVQEISVKVSEALKSCSVEGDLLAGFRTDEICEAPEKAYHKQHSYDFFVVHDEIFNEIDDERSTSNFIYYNLLPQLEQGCCPLKGCVQGRDFEMGRCKVEVLSETLKNSAKIMLLITKKYLENNECYKIYSLIYNGDFLQKVVPILDEDIDLKDLPLGLKRRRCLRSLQHPDWSQIKKELLILQPEL